MKIDFGRTEKCTHDYVRHGTTNLFAALEVTPARSTPIAFPDAAPAISVLHGRSRRGIAGQTGTPRHHGPPAGGLGPAVDAWLGERGNATPHYAPTGRSSMSVVASRSGS